MLDDCLKPLPNWAPDVDHEVAQLLELHELIHSDSYPALPLIVRRAVRVSYAVHFRVLMEFFHDGRPSQADWSRLPVEDMVGAKFSALCEDRTNPFSGLWSGPELERLRDADKLAAHLSYGRMVRRGGEREWGSREDWNLIEPKLQAFFGTTAVHAISFPKSCDAGRRLGVSATERRQP